MRPAKWSTSGPTAALAAATRRTSEPEVPLLGKKNDRGRTISKGTGNGMLDSTTNLPQ